MQKLERRIEELEKANPSDRDMVVIVRFDDPEKIETAGCKEMFSLRNTGREPECQRWKRQPDEELDTFIERAKREVKRNKYGVSILIQDD